MTELTAGMEAPDFTLESDAGTPVSLSALRGNGVVLYFYPKDNTAGCTTEAQGFRDHLADFKALGYEVLGVSKSASEDEIKRAYRKVETVCNLYGVLKEKTMYGRKCFGIERSTFVIDPQGKIIHALRGVKAKTHVDELLELLKQA